MASPLSLQPSSFGCKNQHAHSTSSMNTSSKLQIYTVEAIPTFIHQSGQSILYIDWSRFAVRSPPGLVWGMAGEYSRPILTGHTSYKAGRTSVTASVARLVLRQRFVLWNASLRFACARWDRLGATLQRERFGWHEICAFKSVICTNFEIGYYSITN